MSNIIPITPVVQQIPTTPVIVSATYGGADITYQLRQKLNNTPSFGDFTFTVGNGFFGHDPNPGIVKACVVVYQQLYKYPDGHLAAGNFKTATGKEGQSITLNFYAYVSAGTLGLQEPAATLPSKQYIVSAVWYNADVTANVQKAFSSAFSPNNNTAITVSSEALGIPDPAWGTNKQFSVTYGSYVSGRWVYQAKVSLQQPMSWQLTIPSVVWSDVGISVIFASWGSKDVTAGFNQAYQNWLASDIGALTVPGNYRPWTFTASNATLGGDPNYGVQKAFVVICRVVAWPQSPSGKVNISGYRALSCREGGTINVDVNQMDWSPDPYAWPPSTIMNGYPWVFRAVYSTTDVTNALNAAIMAMAHPPSGAPPAPPITPGTVCSVNMVQVAGGDPWFGVQKQFTMVLGFPTNDGSGNWQLGVYCALQASDTWALPLAPTSTTYRFVKFTNKAPVVAYPQVSGVNISSPSWSPQPQPAWAIDEGQSKTVDLIGQASCLSGYTYNVNFYIAGAQSTSPTTITVNDTPTNGLTLDNYSSCTTTAEDLEIALHVVEFILDIVEAFA